MVFFLEKLKNASRPGILQLTRLRIPGLYHGFNHGFFASFFKVLLEKPDELRILKNLVFGFIPCALRSAVRGAVLFSQPRTRKYESYHVRLKR